MTPPFAMRAKWALAFAVPALAFAAPASAQTTPPPEDEPELIEFDVAKTRTIAVPRLVSPQNVNTPAGSTDALSLQIAEVMAANLEASGVFQAIGPSGVKTPTLAQVTAPEFDYWRGKNANQLIHGFIRVDNDGKLLIGCYLYDVGFGTEQSSAGFRVDPADWRRAAHKCSDAIYGKLTGEMPFFDSRIAYIAETGPKGRRVKRLAVMDSDGANHRFLTNGQTTALTPRWSPDYSKILYLSYSDGNPRIYVYDYNSGTQKLVTESRNPTFAPRWSPDGQSILYSMAIGGNTDIYIISVNGGTPTRLTNEPGIDVGGSFSPDGRQIVFESDRSGSQQIYVMNRDGTGQRRVSRGGGRYATPEWSPRGDLIAFTRIAGDFRVGTMRPDGTGERLLTDSWQDEAPTFAPNGRVIQFFRTEKGSGETSIWQVDLTGANERKLPTPVDGSDPAWGPIRP